MTPESAIERDAARRPRVAKSAARHAEKTRRKLLEEGAEELAQYGFHAAKVARIASRAGVANGTFYLHFPTKEALAEELARIATHDLARRLRRVHASVSDPEQANRAEMEAIVDFVLSNRALVVALLWMGDASRADQVEILAAQRESEIRAAQRAGTYRSSLDASVAARAEVAMISGVLRWWAQSGFAVEREQIVSTLSDLRRLGSRADPLA